MDITLRKGSRDKQIESENKYYLDYLPHKVPPPLPPPLPPPNVPASPPPPCYDVLNEPISNDAENYYSSVNHKKH